MDYFAKISAAFAGGGFWMKPIALFQIISLAIIIERTLALFINRKADELKFVTTFEDNIRRGEMDAVVSKAQAAREVHPVARAVLAGAQAAQNFGGKDEIQGKMDEVLLAENSTLDTRVGYLSMLGNVATLTGLLGTITGMISSFAAVSQADAASKASLLSAGIAEAMNCTAYGLITAIPALVAYAVLQNRANHLSEDLNQAGLKAFNWLSFSFDPVTLRATPPPKSGKSSEANA